MPMHCPICKKRVEEPPAGQKLPSWFPFCSHRCKLIDLGKWLDAEYTIPLEKQADDEDHTEES